MNVKISKKIRDDDMFIDNSLNDFRYFKQGFLIE